MDFTIDNQDYLHDNIASMAVTRRLLEELRSNAIQELFPSATKSNDITLRLLAEVLSSPYLGFDMDDVRQAAEENTSVTSIRLQIPEILVEDVALDNEEERSEGYQKWAEFARAIGSLRNLKDMKLALESNGGNSLTLDWSVAGLFVRRAIGLETLRIDFGISKDDDCQPLALALQSHPNLRRIYFDDRTAQAPMNTLSPQLGTMSRLSGIHFATLKGEGVQFRTLPESFFEQLSSVSNLRELSLRQCVLTQRQCKLLSSALKKTACIQKLDFCDSMFLGSGGLAIAKALQGISTLREFSISLLGLESREVCEALSKAFHKNVGLRLVSIQAVSQSLSDANVFNRFEIDWFRIFFRALGELPAIKELHVCDIDRWTNVVADEFRALLEMPESSVETLQVFSYGRSPAWGRIQPFLQVNTVLRSLKLDDCIDNKQASELMSIIGGRRARLERIEIQTTDRKILSGGRSDHADQSRDFESEVEHNSEDDFFEWLGTLDNSADYFLEKGSHQLKAPRDGEVLQHDAKENDRSPLCIDVGADQPFCCAGTIRLQEQLGSDESRSISVNERKRKTDILAGLV